MTKWLQLTLGCVIVGGLLVAAERPAAAVDEILLLSGGRLTGDFDEAGLVLHTPRGPYQVNRDRVWRLVLDSGATGDVVELRNGNRLSGWLDRTRYSLRLAGGETRAFGRQEVAVVKLGAPSSAAALRQQADVLILKNGDHVAGDLARDEFDLLLPTGPQQFRRGQVWRLWLDSASGDGIQLLNGDLLDGIVSQAAYEVRTTGGQTLTFSRAQVKEIILRLPEKPGPPAAAAGGPAVAAAPTPGPTAPPTVPPAALPPTVRAVMRDLHFEFDRWELTPEARRTLEDVGSALKAYPSLTLLIEGHADERGTVEYNLALGARRAQAAKDYLVGLGIEPGRLDTISYGEERPLDPAHNEVAWALNRRAHFAVKAQ
ncbi:MAG TPA: OmpA family protein [Methylomirabilota bacterium]|jgi:peptidoglycan-associated lipoprotein|nr:OmpA family protein [Methylomirabilota bacterium]